MLHYCVSEKQKSFKLVEPKGKPWEKLQRGEALALLKEMADNPTRITPSWVSLVSLKSDSYELHIKPESFDLSYLKTIVDKHNLALKETNGLIVIYREHNGFQGS